MTDIEVEGQDSEDSIRIGARTLNDELFVTLSFDGDVHAYFAPDQARKVAGVLIEMAKRVEIAAKALDGHLTPDGQDVTTPHQEATNDEKEDEGEGQGQHAGPPRPRDGHDPQR